MRTEQWILNNMNGTVLPGPNWAGHPSHSCGEKRAQHSCYTWQPQHVCWLWAGSQAQIGHTRTGAGWVPCHLPLPALRQRWLLAEEQGETGVALLRPNAWKGWGGAEGWVKMTRRKQGKKAKLPGRWGVSDIQTWLAPLTNGLISLICKVKWTNVGPWWLIGASQTLPKGQSSYGWWTWGGVRSVEFFIFQWEKTVLQLRVPLPVKNCGKGWFRVVP